MDIPDIAAGQEAKTESWLKDRLKAEKASSGRRKGEHMKNNSRLFICWLSGLVSAATIDVYSTGYTPVAVLRFFLGSPTAIGR